ncbi:MAG: hypothetical protein PHP53_19705 [Prolixibacteraceae bacterium]|jgi:ferredoxin--NADP+ reductase|nr:hypothetical protein [Prolixibacteraceae bacterium]
MNKIIAKKSISSDVVRFEIRTSMAVNDIRPGRYILLIVEKDKHGIPAAVVKFDAEKGIITVLVFVADRYSQQLAELNSGSEIYGINGPFGYPLLIENFGTVLCVIRGPGAVMLLPALASLHSAGNRIVTILSARTHDGIQLENEIRAISDEVIFISHNENRGEKGSVCEAITQTLRTTRIDQVFVIGSATIIKDTCVHVSKYNIPIQSILYYDKTAQKSGHGIYKVSVPGTSRAVCVEGFDFNAWYPNLEEMIKRFGREDDIQCNTISTKDVNIPL